MHACDHACMVTDKSDHLSTSYFQCILGENQGNILVTGSDIDMKQYHCANIVCDCKLVILCYRTNNKSCHETIIKIKPIPWVQNTKTKTNKLNFDLKTKTSY